VTWAFRALANVEFLSPAYHAEPCRVTMGGKTFTVHEQCGRFFLKAREIRVGWGYVHGGIGVLVGFLVVFWAIQAWAISVVRFDKLRISRTAPGDVKRKDMWVAASTTNEPPGAGGGVSGDPGGGVGHIEPEPSAFVGQVKLAVWELGYSIPQPSTASQHVEHVDLLKGVSMWALPKRMTALMGASGAGKTTLLDVLAGIKTVGVTRGQILLNGKPMSKTEFTKAAGYVQQFGVHSPTATIRESLVFSAALRFSGSTEQRTRLVDETLRLLELDAIASQLAGACSMEQNKRLTLGVELVANPSIVFADEPTSGLDARAATFVMRCLQRVARSGRVVVCTIHQPSIANFNRFDDLLLLKRGGEVAYFGELGPQADKLIGYLERIPGVPKCQPGANPAAWMLEVIGEGTGVRRQAVADVTQDDDDVEAQAPLDFAAIYRRSELKKRNDQRMRDEFGVGGPDAVKKAAAVPFPSTSSSTLSALHDRFKAGAWTQLRMLCWRNWLELWRSPEFSLQRVFFATLFMLIYVAIYFQQPLANTADVQSRILCVSFSMTMVSMFTLMTIM